MAKRSYPSNDFYKHRDGRKRQARLDEWYENRQGHAEANNLFTATKGGVPNNPNNFQSYTPVASQFAPVGQPDGDVVYRRNPYGDGEQIVRSEGPVAATPTQWGVYGSAPDVDPKLDKPNFLQTPGPGSEMSAPREMSPPRGMNTGLGSFGSGPRRNEEKPASNA